MSGRTRGLATLVRRAQWMLDDLAFRIGAGVLDADHLNAAASAVDETARLLHETANFHYREIGSVMTKVRRAVDGDLGAVAEIFAHYVEGSTATFETIPPDVGQWRLKLDALADRGLPFLVAEIGAEVVGFGYAGPWRPKPAYRHTVEDTVYLAPGWTGRGLGKSLLNTLMADSARAGSTQMIAVITDDGDDSSVALHRACGFQEVGRLHEVGHKFGRWIGTALLQRKLDPVP
ncbi:N-acetyltransferase family protein [Saccharopolyspora sp. NPDC000995]